MDMHNATTSTRQKDVTAPFLPLLETLIPGLSLVSNLLASYVNVDITSYFSAILLLAALTVSINYCKTFAWGIIGEHFISTAEIRLDDEMYNYLMFWVSKQTFARKTGRFVAGTKTNSEMVYVEDDSDDDDTIDESIETGLNEDFEKHWTELMNSDRLKPLRYTPSDGNHNFRYKGHFLTFTRVKDDKQANFRTSNSERIYISCLGRNPQIIKDLLEEAQRLYVKRDGNKTVIYRGNGLAGSGTECVEWVRCLSRPPRPLSTVVLDEAQKQSFISDVKEYLHPLTRRWYSNRGIPYRRGYLLCGPPGTGKTSLCFAVAGLLSLSIYVVSLNSRSLTEDSLASLFRYLPWRCIVLLEDIDAAGLTNKRNDEPPDDIRKLGDQVNQDATPSSGPIIVPAAPSGISLSAFLNIIDGVASGEGRILVMTTNHIERLDAALLRPGRVDMTIGFGYADHTTIRGLYKAVYVRLEADSPIEGAKMNGTTASPQASKPTISAPQTMPSLSARIRNRHHGKSDEEIDRLATKFADILPPKEFTPAEIQGYLLGHKKNPDGAIEKVGLWVDAIREEKRKRK